MPQVDPFTPIYPISKLNKDFVSLMQRKGWSSARSLIRYLFQSFPDPDGNFLEQFQTTGYDPRVWELYLWAYLGSDGFTIVRPSSAPDFLVEKSGIKIGIEAVTANPSQRISIPPEIRDMPVDIDSVAIKLGSALYSKLKKNIGCCHI